MNDAGNCGNLSSPPIPNLVSDVDVKCSNCKLPAKPSTNIPPANICLLIDLLNAAHSCA